MAKVVISASVDEEVRDITLQMGKADNDRPFSAMVNILLKEAIEMRAKQLKPTT